MKNNIMLTDNLKSIERLVTYTSDLLLSTI